EIGRATLGDYVPLSGTVTAVDAGRRTVTLTSQSGAFRMRFVLHVAESANLASFVLGHRLSLSAALDAGGALPSGGTAAAPTAPRPPGPPPGPARPPPRPTPRAGRRPRRLLRRPPRPRRRSPRTRARSPRRPSTASSPSGRARARAARFSAASTCPSDTACCGSATRSPRTTTTPARTSTASSPTWPGAPRRKSIGARAPRSSSTRWRSGSPCRALRPRAVRRRGADEPQRLVADLPQLVELVRGDEDRVPDADGVGLVADPHLGLAVHDHDRVLVRMALECR